MNTTKYLQTSSPWGGLGYPKKPCYIRNVGCGEVAIANSIIEMEQYKNYTPATIQPYCKQYGEKHCNGTFHSGIPAMMKHYGMTEVKEHATMSTLWTELAKGGRIAIYLMGSRKGGSKGVHWTSSGHFVMSSGYKFENGKHWVYVKDSYSNSPLRNKWISYEGNMRNDVVKVWSGKLNSTKPQPTPSGKLTVDGIGGKATVKAMQKFFGTTVDGVISGQSKPQSKYYPSLTAVEYGKGGSACVKKLQKWLGIKQDGIIGRGTTCAWQKKLRDEGYLAKKETIDGYFGVKSMKAWQKYLNDHDKAVYPTPTPTPAPTPTPKPNETYPEWVQRANAWAEEMAKDPKAGYRKWSAKDKSTHECLICHPETDPKHKWYKFTWQCIGFAMAYLHHGGGIHCKCSCHTIDDAFMTKLLTMDKTKALKLLREKMGSKDFDLIRNNKKVIPQSQMKPGDLCITYNSKGKATHIYPYIGGGKMIDCGNWKDKKKQIAKRDATPCKVIIRYIGK